MNEGEWFTAAEAAQETGKHRTTVRHDLNKLYYAGVVERKIKDDKTRLYCFSPDTVDTDDADELLTTPQYFINYSG